VPPLTPGEKHQPDQRAQQAELALEAKPTNRWLKMSVEFLRDEVETLKRLQIKYDNQEPSQRQPG